MDKEAIFAKEYDELLQKMRDTKECRIRAYNRCKYWSGLLNVMSGIYGALVVLLSILLLDYSGQDLFLQYLLICLSIVSLVFTFIINNAGYDEMYHNYKNSFNYIETLLSELKNINYIDDLNKKIELLKIVNDKYLIEIASSQNHKDVDYYQYKMDTFHRNEIKTDQDIKKWHSIKKQYIKYKSMDYVCKLFITLGLYFIFSLLYHLVILIKTIAYCFKKKK